MKKYTSSLLIMIGLVVAGGLSFVSAWTAAPPSPPGSNVYPPVNVGTGAQVKNGDLTVNKFIAFDTAAFFGNVGIGTASPGFQLEVSKSQAAPTIARVTNSSTASGAQSRLDVVGGSPNNYGIFNVSESGTGANWAALAIGDGPAAFYIQAGATATNHPIYFYQGATQRAAIDASGNLTSAREIISTLGTGSGQFRMISGAYGAFWRNDGANTYLLFTNANDQYGSWNAIRPFWINDVNGDMLFANGQISFTHATGVAAKPGGGSWTASSDARLKTNIAPMHDALSRVTQLQGVTFDWKNPNLHGGQAASGGFIAQDVAKVFPDFVGQSDCRGADCGLVGGTGSKEYNLTLPFAFDAYLVESVKELKKENDDLRGDVEALKQEFEAYKRAHQVNSGG